MNFNSGKWGATPDVYTISFVKRGGSGELVVSFFLQGNVGPAPQTNATSFSVTCNNVNVISNGSPVTLYGLPNNNNYSCTVVATNSFGSSSASTSVVGAQKSKLDSSIAPIIIMLMMDP